MIKPEADIILAIHRVKKDLGGLLPCKHVYAHQDTRKRVEASKKMPKPGVQLECKVKVAHREMMVSVVGASEETLSLSEESSDRDDSFDSSLDKKSNQESQTEGKQKEPPKPKKLEVTLNIECNKQASVVSKAELEGGNDQEQCVL